jgi:RecA-family ATPase
MTVRADSPPIDIPSARRKREQEQAAREQQQQQQATVEVVGDEWQDVREGALYPNGCQYRLNLTTGKQQVRIAKDQEQAQAAELPEPLAMRLNPALRHDAALRQAWEHGDDAELAQRMREFGRAPHLAGAVGDRFDEQDIALATRARAARQHTATDPAKNGADPAAAAPREEKPNAAVTIEPIDFPSLPDVEPPPRRFILKCWAPAAILSSLYGPPGVGKSFLAQQIATCVVANLDVFGFTVERVPVLGLFAEEDREELERRQWRINQALGLKNRQLADLHLEGRLGFENTLVTFPNGAPALGPLFDAAVKAGKDHGLIILDNRAQMILGNENDRMVATYGGNLCARLGRETGAAVLLIGHPAKAEGSEYSGSTGWDAVTRSRWFLQRLDDDQDGTLLLKLAKTNYAPDGAQVLLRWRDGIFRPIDPGRMTPAELLELKLRQGAACQGFLDGLDSFTSEGRPLSHSNRAENFAPKLIAEKADGFSFAELKAAMEQLFTDGRIEANAIIGRGKDRHPIRGIARTIPPAEPPA